MAWILASEVTVLRVPVYFFLYKKEEILCTGFMLVRNHEMKDAMEQKIVLIIFKS